MSKPWLLVCPANRGIGYNLTKRLLQHSNYPILATTRRDPAGVKKQLLNGIQDEAQHSSRLHIVQVDVTDESTIEAASKHAAELFPSDQHHLHLAFAMPGILYPEKSLRQVDAEHALMTYRVNTLGPLLLMKWFSDFMPRRGTQIASDKKASQGSENSEKLQLPSYSVWLNMSARVGSISDNRSGGWFSYRSSKAAVNNITKSFDHMVRTRSGDRAMAIAYHPGTV